MSTFEIGDRVTKDGRPGTIIGDGDGELAYDIRLDDGTETFVRFPDYGKRLKPLGQWDLVA